jgi:hypothetical protein
MESGSRPVDISEEEVAAAGKGKSEEVLRGLHEPVELSEEDVRAASEGRSKDVLKGKLKEHQGKSD